MLKFCHGASLWVHNLYKQGARRCSERVPTRVFESGYGPVTIAEWISLASGIEPVTHHYITLHYITLQNKFVIRQIQKCPTAKYIVHLKCTVK